MVKHLQTEFSVLLVSIVHEALLQKKKSSFYY